MNKKQQLNSIVVNSPIGCLAITLNDDEQLAGIRFLGKTKLLIKPTSPFAKKVVQQLQNYFTDSTFNFDLPMQIAGTPFQQKVWRIMQKIPRGKTLSYGEVAEKLNSSPRAVGNACRANHIPIIIPCHRIVAKNGLGGFNGATHGALIDIKTWLLEHESTK